MMQDDLFDKFDQKKRHSPVLDDDPVETRYPDKPGWKEDDTSREAAEAITPVAGRLRKLTLAYITAHPRCTADQVAAGVGVSLLTIRPRVSELRKQKRIVNDGRGRNASGKAAHLWRLSEVGEMR